MAEALAQDEPNPRRISSIAEGSTFGGAIDIDSSFSPILIIENEVIVRANVAAHALLMGNQRGELLGLPASEVVVGLADEIFGATDGPVHPDLISFKRLDGKIETLETTRVSISENGTMWILRVPESPSMANSSSSAEADALAAQVGRLKRHVRRLLELERFFLTERDLNEKLFQLTQEAIAVTKNGAVTLCNDAFARYAGLTIPAEAVGRPIESFFEPATDSESGGETETGWTERTLRRPDGTALTVESMVAEFDEGGDAFAVWISRDLAPRRTAEAKLRESEERYRTLFDLSPAGLMVIGDHIEDANRRLVEILGLRSPSELVGKLPIDFTHEMFHDDVRRRMELDDRIDWSQPVDRIYVRPDGTQRNVELTGDFVHYDGRRLFVLAVRDVTDARVAAARLAENEERFELALQGGRQGVWDWDIERDSATFSSEWLEMIGLSEDEYANGTLDSWLELIHPDDVDQAWQKQSAHMNGETPGYEAEFRMRHKDGSWVWVLSRGRVTKRAPDGKALRIVGTHTNVSDRKAAEVRIAALNEELLARATMLESSNAELEAFAYSVSHDLRAPLRSIDGYASELATDHKDCFSAEGRELLGRIRSSANRLSQLIDDLLALSRVTRQPIERRELDVTAMAESLCEELRRRTPNRVVECEIEPNMRALGDPKLIQIVLENLLSNAFKFTQGAQSGHIRVGSKLVGGVTEFFVADNGIGFDKKYSSNLFRPFARLHADIQFEGHGIGLATVQRIVARHGGSVRAESSPGAGATFSFHLS